MRYLPDELRWAIIDTFAPDELLDFLDVSTAETVDAFEDKILENLPRIVSVLRYENEDDN